MNEHILLLLSNQEEITIEERAIVYSIRLDNGEIFLLDSTYNYAILAFVGTGKEDVQRLVPTLISAFNPRGVINLGIAGSRRYKPGSIVFSDYADYAGKYETDIIGLQTYETNFIKAFVRYCNDIGSTNCIEGHIQTSNCFIELDNRFTLNSIDCIEMEAAAIYKICKENLVPCMFIKYISDEALVNARLQVEDNLLAAKGTLGDILKFVMQYAKSEKLWK